MISENVCITAIICLTFKLVFFRWADFLEESGKQKQGGVSPFETSEHKTELSPLES